MATAHFIKVKDARSTLESCLTKAEEITAVLKAARSKVDWQYGDEMVPLGDVHPLIEKAESLAEEIWDLDSESVSAEGTEELLHYER